MRFCLAPRLPADCSGLAASGFLPEEPTASIGNDVVGVLEEERWGVLVPLDDVTAGTALALSVPDDPVKDDRGCWAESSVRATALGCWSKEKRACLTGGPSDFLADALRAPLCDVGALAPLFPPHCSSSVLYPSSSSPRPLAPLIASTLRFFPLLPCWLTAGAFPSVFE